MTPGLMKYMRGQCFNFALALAETAEEEGLRFAFVAVGDPRFPDHAALEIEEGCYADARGLSDTEGFLSGIAGEGITRIGRTTVELHSGLAGVESPYEDCEEMDEARSATARVFQSGLSEAVSAWNDRYAESGSRP